MINIATIITAIRMISIFFIIHALLQQYFFQAGAWFVFAGITDIVDGYVARRFNMVTEFGGRFDAFVDKLLMGSVACVIYWLYGPLFPPFVAIMLVLSLMKEVLFVSFGLLVWFLWQQYFAATKLARITSFFEFMFFVVAILWLVWPIVYYLLIGLAVINLLLMIFLLIEYCVRIIRANI